MIRIVHIAAVGPTLVDLSFSDGSSGQWDGSDILARDTIMTRPLADPAYFKRAFIEAGALAWPNGLEFSGHTLHAKLDARGKLIRRAA